MDTKTKNIIVSLHKQGVGASVIAKAFGIRKAQVSAYVAWNTMRSR